MTTDTIARALLGMPQLVEPIIEPVYSFKIACKKIYNMINDDLISYYIKIIIDESINSSVNNQGVIAKIENLFNLGKRKSSRKPPNMSEIIRRDLKTMSQINDLIRDTIKKTLLMKLNINDTADASQIITQEQIDTLTITETELSEYINNLQDSLKTIIEEMAKNKLNNRQSGGMDEYMDLETPPPSTPFNATQIYPPFPPQQQQKTPLDKIIDDIFKYETDPANKDKIEIGPDTIQSVKPFETLRQIITRSGRKIRTFVQILYDNNSREYVPIDGINYYIGKEGDKWYLINTKNTQQFYEIKKESDNSYTYDDLNYSLRFGIYRGGRKKRRIAKKTKKRTKKSKKTKRRR